MFTKRNYCVGIIIFVAVWVLILAVPKTRNILRSQIEESKHEDVYWTQLQTGIRADRLDKYLSAHPNNFTIKAASLEREQSGFPDPNNPNYKEYDQLIEKHPKSIWLIKRRLLMFTLWKKLEMGDKFQQRQNLSLPVLSKYAPQEISDGLKLAHTGAQMEPENSFFDWMQANLLFAQGKTQLALKTLENGSHKKYFDDGYAQVKQANLDAIQFAGFNLFEEKFMLATGVAGIGFNDCFKETNAAAVWQGALAEKQGDNHRALKIYDTQLRLCSIMASNSRPKLSTDYFINGMALSVWLSQKRYAQWKNGMPHFKRQQYSHTEFRKIQREGERYNTIVAAQLFAKYALSNHDPDAAKSAINFANQRNDEWNSVTDLLMDEINGSYNALFGKYRFQALYQLKWTGMQLLLSLFKTLILAWGVITVFVLLIMKGKQQLQSILNQQISKTTIISTLIFVLCLYGVLLTFLLHQGISSNYIYQVLSSPNETLKSFAQKYLFWTLFVVSLLYCGIAVLWKCRKSTFVNEAQDAFTSSMTEEQLKTRNHRISNFWQIMFWIILAIIEAAWFWWNISSRYSFALILTPLVIGIIVWWIIKNVTLPQPVFFTGTYWLLFAIWLQRSLAVLILIFTLAYGVTSWASLPLRHDANIQLNHVLKVGQMTALREALARDKTQNPDTNSTE